MTILSAKRSKKDFKVYAIVRENLTEPQQLCLSHKYLYGIICLDKEGGKHMTPIQFNNLSYVRKRFKAIN